MKKIPLFVLAMLLLALCYSHAVAQGSTSNKGTEFWTAWMDHIDGAGSNMSLYITGDVNTTGTVTAADNSFIINFTVTANQVTIVTIPTSVYLATEGQFNKGIHITAAKNIVVYAHIYANNRSAATLVLPVNAMGKDYYSVNYTQKAPSTAYSTFCVIATEDNTTVEITPTSALTSGKPAGVAFQLTLQKGELYQGLSLTDLTGTRIKSISTGTQTCKKIAAYSGSSFINITCSPGKSSSDNLFQQAYPTAAWGKNYVTAPLKDRGYDIFRIAYSDPTANVQLNGVTIPPSALTNGFYYEFSSTIANVITSDKPIQVVQYAVTQGSTINCGSNNADVGDPEMIYLSPIEQGLDHVTLYSTNKQNITKTYINVIIETTAASSFMLDGVNYPNFTPVPGNTAYAYQQINVSSGATHNISASSPFNAIAYGFGNIESYGYSAGTDIKNLNEFVALKDPITNTTTTLGCAGVSYKLQLTIPYPTSSIKWDFKDGTTPVTETPIYIGQITKGTQTLYTYQYTKTVTYTTAANYAVVATVLNPTADDCGSDEDIELDYTISDTPDAKFTASATACPNDAVSFNNQTDNKGLNVKTYAWDFGDPVNATTSNPNTSSTQNATHIYIQPGNYSVTLTVTNDNGCSTTTAPQVIHINASPVASFGAASAGCVKRDVTFTDNSVANEGSIIAWQWNFDDGTTDPPRTDKVPFSHQFAATGTYNVSLTVTSSTGCISSAFTKQLVINPLPEVDFTLPDACLFDSPKFESKSTIADHTESEFTYAWNFGDPNATAADNVSALPNPTHHYSEARDDTNPYIITLTVTSKYGCDSTLTKKFTVNGASPTANFTEDNPQHCSSDDVVFTNDAHVGFGKITSVKMYWDWGGDQANYTVYTKTDALAGSKLSHNYGIFNTPGLTKTYQVKMFAYSGSAESCIGESATKSITIKANPKIDVPQIGPLCQESNPVTIVPQQNGFTGTGTFSGIGVTAAGVFDPSVSGAGTFKIDYVFVANNDCSYSSSQMVTVNATPKVSAGNDFNMLEGAGKTIKASVTGDAPFTYKWTLIDGSKATGLDHDDVLQPIASPADNITYMLTVITANNCSASSTVNVTVLKAPIVPNTFTPNNDGVNDRWEIKYLQTYPNCTVEVYNRLGEKLYSSIGYPIPWDGLYKGAQLPVGTYYYIINPKNGRKVIAGSVTIIR